MKNNRTIIYLASWISALGHPFIISTAVILFISFRTLEIKFALTSLLLFLVIFIFPVVLFIRHKIRKEVYQDFDISEQKGREKFYHLAIPLMIALSSLFYFWEPLRILALGTILATGLVTLSYLANFFLKSSLHTAFNFYFGIVFLSWHFPLGMALCVFAIIVACTRLLLKRHTFPEIVTGFLIGIASGAAFCFFI